MMSNMHHRDTAPLLSLLLLCLQLCQVWMPDFFFCQCIRGSKFSLSPLDWEGKGNTLCTNDFTSFLNSCKEKFIWTAPTQAQLFHCSRCPFPNCAHKGEMPMSFFLLCPKTTHQCFLGWRKNCSCRKGLNIITEPLLCRYNDKSTIST